MAKSDKSESKGSKGKSVSLLYKIGMVGGLWVFSGLMAIAIRSNSFEKLLDPQQWLKLGTLPEGLVGLMPLKAQYAIGDIAWVLLIWMTYAALTIAAAAAKKSTPFHLFWTILAALLLANVFGPRLF